MQTIKVNGIEIEFEDGLDIAIEGDGKRIVVKGKPAPEVVRLVPVQPLQHNWIYNPVYPSPYLHPSPQFPWIICQGTSSATVATENTCVSSSNLC